ncbi:MAG: CDP-alcohol phosphatidyltransferase family protein [Deltaproteobacteria bacterium]|nr:CDP-alcohol phosphatidyltransferase family protein [Deltaproteobacteria bacterium]
MDSPPQAKPPKFNLATKLTLLRFILVPVFTYYFLIDNFKLAVIILFIASITDVTDGLLARRFHMATELGSVLDPLADKFLMMITFLVLTAKDILPWWLTVVVIGRDFYIVIGALYLYFIRQLQILFKPTILSKRTTFAQFTLLVFSFIRVYIEKKNPDINPQIITLVSNVQFAMIYIALLLTIITFFQYTQHGLTILRQNVKRETI